MLVRTFLKNEAQFTWSETGSSLRSFPSAEFGPVSTDGNPRSVLETDTDPENPLSPVNAPILPVPSPRPVVSAACSWDSHSRYLFVFGFFRSTECHAIHQHVFSHLLTISEILKANTPSRLRNPSPVLPDTGPKSNRPVSLKLCSNSKLVPGGVMEKCELLWAEAM